MNKNQEAFIVVLVFLALADFGFYLFEPTVLDLSFIGLGQLVFRDYSNYVVFMTLVFAFVLFLTVRRHTKDSLPSTEQEQS